MHPRSIPACSMLALLLLASVPATTRAAQGVGLAWNNCLGGAGAAQNATFACDTNTGSQLLVGTFRLEAPMADVIGLEMVVDLAAQSATLPAWWEFRYEGACRRASMNSVVLPDPTEVSCTDWSLELAQGGIAGYCTLANAMPVGCGLPGQPANRARIKMITAVAPGSAQDLIGGQDYFAFALRINHAKTVGTGACGGCDVPVCLVYNSVAVVGRDNYETRTLTNAHAPGGNAVAWQGGGAGGLPGCLVATPARTTTWGAVKSLYR